MSFTWYFVVQLVQIPNNQMSTQGATESTVMYVPGTRYASTTACSWYNGTNIACSCATVYE